MVRLFFCFNYKQIQIFQIYFNFFFLTIPTFKITPKQMLLLPPHIRSFAVSDAFCRGKGLI